MVDEPDDEKRFRDICDEISRGMTPTKTQVAEIRKYWSDRGYSDTDEFRAKCRQYWNARHPLDPWPEWDV